MLIIITLIAQGEKEGKLIFCLLLISNEMPVTYPIYWNVVHTYLIVLSSCLGKDLNESND